MIPKLELKNVSKAWGGNVIFRNTSQTFLSGNLTAIVGLNGSGKTTLLDLLCGISQLDNGDILVNGSSIKKLNLPDVFNLGIARLFQESRIFENMTVEENIMIAYPGNLYRSLFAAFFQRRILRKERNIRSEKVDKLLEVLGLENRKGALAKNISYGEQRLLAIGRMLATSASIFLLDEPSSGIKVELSESIFKFIKSRAIEGHIIIVVEHNLDLVTRYADIILVISKKGIKFIPKSSVTNGNNLSKIIEEISYFEKGSE